MVVVIIAMVVLRRVIARGSIEAAATIGQAVMLRAYEKNMPHKLDLPRERAGPYGIR
jgi:hypothetical protein